MGTRDLAGAVRRELLRLAPGPDCCRETELKVLIQCWLLVGTHAPGPGDPDSPPFFTTCPSPSLYRRAYRLAQDQPHFELNRQVEFISASPEIDPNRSEAPRSSSRNRSVLFLASGSLMNSILPDAARARHNLESWFKSQRAPCCVASGLRALYLVGGSLTASHARYHLEIVLPPRIPAGFLPTTVDYWDVKFLSYSRRSRTVLYLKSGSRIAELLGHMGAVSAMLSLEDVQISRRLRESINRNVNMEISNLRRSSLSASAEVADIEFLVSCGLMETLPERLQEVAKLRMEHPTMELRELARLAPGTLTKSGVYHRIRAIRHHARDARKSHDDESPSPQQGREGLPSKRIKPKCSRRNHE